MALFRSSSLCEEGNRGDSCYEQNATHPAVLYPPSYFRTAEDAGRQEESLATTGHSRAAAATTSPASTYVVSRHASPREACSSDIAALRRENESLRSQLEAVGHTGCNALPLPRCISQYPPPPAVLTSDLLQVERSLQQSRVAQLETEVRRLAAAEVTLREERASHTRDRENLIARHHAEMEGVRREVEGRWRRECEEWRERVVRVEEGEREKMEELRLAEQKLASTAQEKTDICGQLEEERSAHTEQVASLQLQLRAATDQNEIFQGELEVARESVGRLESYLGGELPEEGVTWREERAALLARISEMEGDRERDERDSQLMAVRLAAISEILSLQETALTPGTGGGGAVERGRDSGLTLSREEGREGGGGGGREGGYKGLLTLWREKVFTLLVQARLAQMQHETESFNTQAKVSAMEAEVREARRERDLVTHTLTDRTAQLQLLTTQNEELVRSAGRAEEGWSASQRAAEVLSGYLHLAESGVGERCARLKACLDGCLSRLANYQQRVGVATGRVSALKALIGSQMVLGEVKITRDIPLGGDDVIAERCDVTTQTEPSQKSQELSKLPCEVLVEEVVCLMRERDNLSQQLAHSTLSLQQLTISASERQGELEETCTSLTAESTTLRDELEGVRGEVEGLRKQLEGVTEREASLVSAQASLQTRIDGAVMEERRRGREMLNEAQDLLEVARREQTKTALQLQRCQRKLEEERAGSVEAAEVARQGVEDELQRCRERLRAVQVERNLLLTTLRQEGIKVPPRRPPPLGTLTLNPPRDGAASLLPQTTGIHQHILPTNTTRTQRPTARDLHPCTDGAENGHPVTVCPSHYLHSSPSSTPDRSSVRDSGEDGGIGEGGGIGVGGETGEGGEGGSDGVSKVLQIQETGKIDSVSPPHLTSSRQCNSSQEDIQNVLKELQLLSAALLDMNDC